MSEPVHVDTWRLNVRRWLIGAIGPDGEQLTLPGMPEPPRAQAFRSLLGWLPSYANWNDGRDIAVSVHTLAQLLGCSDRWAKSLLREARLSGVIVLTKRHNQHAPNRHALARPDWLVGEAPAPPGLSTGDLVGERGFPYQVEGLTAQKLVGELGEVGRGTGIVGRGTGGTPTRDQLPERGSTPSLTPPSEFCSKHPQGTEEKCGPCGGARRRHLAWLERDELDRSRRNAPRRAVDALADVYCESCGNPVTRHMPGCAAAA